MKEIGRIFIVAFGRAPIKSAAIMARSIINGNWWLYLFAEIWKDKKINDISQHSLLVSHKKFNVLLEYFEWKSFYLSGKAGFIN